MSVSPIIGYTIIVTGFLWIIYQVWTLSHFGKLIIKAEKGKVITILWVGFLFIWIALAWLNKNSAFINYVLYALGVLISIVGIIRSQMDKQIREKGIYCNLRFYKWSQIKGYRWISEKIIKFDADPDYLSGGNFELIIKEELKSKTNEALQKYVAL